MPSAEYRPTIERKQKVIRKLFFIILGTKITRIRHQSFAFYEMHI